MATPVPSPEPDYPEWELNKLYQIGDKVIYRGQYYICFQAHSSNSGWAPDVTSGVLWRQSSF